MLVLELYTQADSCHHANDCIISAIDWHNLGVVGKVHQIK